jgi:hypothetical protein
MLIRYTIKWTQEIEDTIKSFWLGRTKSIVLESAEIGRVLLIHTSKKGEFVDYSTQEVIQLFELWHVGIIFTCFPSQQYQNRPAIAEKLHIQFPECNTPVWHSYEKDYIDNICMLCACTSEQEARTEQKRQRDVIENKRMKVYNV